MLDLLPRSRHPGGEDHPEYPPQVREAMARGRRLEWWSLVWLASVIAIMGLVTGQSQAMRTAWIEDCLSLLPPAFFLLATWFESRAPTHRFPYGFHRTASLAFFAAAAVLLSFGSVLIYGAVATLIRQEHPAIGSLRIAGEEVWLGWLMILALAYSIVPPVILGHLKQRPAELLNDKVLVTDSEMNKADWQTGVAGILGILGIAWGFWWADALAAGLIAVSILWDGVGALRKAVAELVDGAPRDLRSDRIDDEALLLGERARQLGARIVLRETGRVITGVLESRDPADLGRITHGLSWRVRDLSWRPLGDRDL
ncbi:cation transporter [Rubellimicrobium arenae]|uniref:cation transporter n=1 Tax=Rubellimicrobium arenae TaxID=2817372 RepID=UPI001FEE9792|nr:cation transporter [Rubellimicrobium arenae]